MIFIPSNSSKKDKLFFKERIPKGETIKFAWNGFTGVNPLIYPVIGVIILILLFFGLSNMLNVNRFFIYALCGILAYSFFGVFSSVFLKSSVRSVVVTDKKNIYVFRSSFIFPYSNIKEIGKVLDLPTKLSDKKIWNKDDSTGENIWINSKYSLQIESARNFLSA